MTIYLRASLLDWDEEVVYRKEEEGVVVPMGEDHRTRRKVGGRALQFMSKINNKSRRVVITVNGTQSQQCGGIVVRSPFSQRLLGHCRPLSTIEWRLLSLTGCHRDDSRAWTGKIFVEISSGRSGAGTLASWRVAQAQTRKRPT